MLAVVIGAGIAGMCAAQVLADTYDQVTLLDRDRPPDNDDPRAGAPQGRHVHAVLVSGNRALRELFPGLVEEAIADGVPTGDLLADARAYFGNDRMVPTPSGLEGIYIGRPELERRLRDRLRQRQNVTLLPAHNAVGLTTSPDGAVITGVRSTPVGSPHEQVLPADLVVDASGRTSRMPAWLADIGYEAPPEQQVGINVAYSSCTFSMAADAIQGDHGVLVAPTPANPRGAGLIDMGRDRWLVSLTAYGDTPLPVDVAGFVEFTRTLRVPDIYQALRNATPTGTPVRYRIPAAIRRHYEMLARFPERLVVLGDATSVFNPIYAQGMSVAARQALALRDHLRVHGPDRTAALRSRLARAGSAAWTMSVNYDLRMPWIPGRRSLVVRLGNAYLGLVHAAAARDAIVARAFMRVANLLDPPGRLARPSIAVRVMLGAFLRRRKPGSAMADVVGEPSPAQRALGYPHEDR